MAVFAHLGRHFLREEGRPQLLHHVLVHELLLVLVIAVCSRRLSNFPLTSLPALTLASGLFTVVNGRLQSKDPLLSLLLVTLDVQHEIVQTELGLQLRLSSNTLLFEFLLVNLVL